MNWGGMKPDEPRGYPGWTGNVSYTMNTDYREIPFFKPLNNTGINTGSGGGSCNSYGYGVSIFEADFPSLAVMERLKR